jgi:hypothetical protein
MNLNLNTNLNSDKRNLIKHIDKMNKSIENNHILDTSVDSYDKGRSKTNI